jgi:hypothetical protein
MNVLAIAILIVIIWAVIIGLGWLCIHLVKKDLQKENERNMQKDFSKLSPKQQQKYIREMGQ